MKKNYILSILQVSIIFLFFYNIFSLTILYANNLSFKLSLWEITPYDYKKITLSPNYLAKKSLLNESNRDLILSFLNKNMQKNYLDINYWDYKKIIESYDRKNHYEFEKSFYKNFILSKNNPNKYLILKNNFSLNYLKFSKKYRNLIIKNF